MLLNYKVIKINKLNQLPSATKKIKNFVFLAGGTDLAIQLKEKKINPDTIIDISGIKELKGIKEDKNNIYIGSLTKIEDILNSKPIKIFAPSLICAAESLGSTQIRNMATIGGNIITASPIGDMLPPLYAHGSNLILTNGKIKRMMPIEKFIIGYRETALKNGEILKAIVVRKKKNYFDYFKKIGQRKTLCISKVSLALSGHKEDEKIKDIKIALGAVGEKVTRAKGVEAVLVEKKLGENLIENACKLLTKEISPITDIRSTIEYRLKLSRELLKEALFELMKS